MPAPKGNTNNLQSGLRSHRALVLGMLPASCRGIVRDVATFRRTLEAAVLEVRNEIGVYEQAVIATACKWERHSALALRWLRNGWATMTDEQKLRFHEATCRAAENRDRCLKALGLDVARYSRDSLLPDSLFSRVINGTTAPPATTPITGDDAATDVGEATSEPAAATGDDATASLAYYDQLPP